MAEQQREPTEHHQEQRQRVLDAAVHLFAEHGYEATGMRAIADEVGIRPASLYYYFPSKETILETLFTVAAEGPRRGVSELTRVASLREVLAAAGHGFLQGVSVLREKRVLEIVFLAAHQRPDWGQRYLAQLSDPAQEGLAAAIDRVLPAQARQHVQSVWLAKQFIGALLSFVLHEEVIRREGENDPDREGYLRQLVAVMAGGTERLAAQ
ncbi:MAG: hypothetical protein CL878_15530 [Dehalococcoidia bacterium]|nr:hypothetical protein [Dehalococcoidia bacterium]